MSTAPNAIDLARPYGWRAPPCRPRRRCSWVAGSREHPETDAIYVACPPWPTVDIIEALERDVRKPVIPAPAAWIWGAFKALVIREGTPGYGRLLDSPRAP